MDNNNPMYTLARTFISEKEKKEESLYSPIDLLAAWVLYNENNIPSYYNDEGFNYIQHVKFYEKYYDRMTAEIMLDDARSFNDYILQITKNQIETM